MKRSAPMKRGTPLKRTPFKPKGASKPSGPAPERIKKALAPVQPRAGVVMATAASLSQPAERIEKDEPVRDERYKRLVARLPCILCGVDGYSQAAHPNTGKGMGIKASDDLIFPLCCSRPGVQGCHDKFDQHALFTKEKRRDLEPLFAQRTKEKLKALGLL